MVESVSQDFRKSVYQNQILYLYYYHYRIQRAASSLSKDFQGSLYEDLIRLRKCADVNPFC